MGRQLANMVLESTFTKLTVLRGTQCLFIKKKMESKTCYLIQTLETDLIGFEFCLKNKEDKFFEI